MTNISNRTQKVTNSKRESSGLVQFLDDPSIVPSSLRTLASPRSVVKEQAWACRLYLR